MSEKGTSPTKRRTQSGSQGRRGSVEDSFKIAKSRMREAGFDIGDNVEVAVDPRLPIMGYTMSGQDSRFRITVSGMAVKSGMLEGLLAHEMSHIYRMRTKHPSHNPRIIQEATDRVTDGGAIKDYQRKILHNLVNNVEDLYADDIAFKVIRKAGLLTPDQASEFLQSWVEDRPAESRDATRVRWENAWSLANNARAIAQMSRHGIEDTGGRAAAANDRLLSRLGSPARRPFEYFRELLANLKEEITEGEYRELLVGYLGRFRQFASERDRPTADR